MVHKKNPMFKDRMDAGQRLAERLQEYKGQDLVVLAIPRGGLPIGAIIARSLQAPLDVVLSKKIGHPNSKEFTIGAVSMEHMILGDTTGIERDYIEKETVKIRRKLSKDRERYYKKKKPVSLRDKVVLIVDDGIATGNTILVTAELIHALKPRKTIVAIPVAPKSAIPMLKASPYIDEVICLAAAYNFQAVGQFYQHFHQVSNEEAIAILEESAPS